MCEAIYIDNTHQTSKIKKDGNLFCLLCPIKNGKKSDSFATNFKHHFKYTISRTDLRKLMVLKLVKNIKLIGPIKISTKHNCNLCMEERLTILKIYI